MISNRLDIYKSRIHAVRNKTLNLIRRKRRNVVPQRKKFLKDITKSRRFPVYMNRLFRSWPDIHDVSYHYSVNFLENGVDCLLSLYGDNSIFSARNVFNENRTASSSHINIGNHDRGHSIPWNCNICFFYGWNIHSPRRIFIFFVYNTDATELIRLSLRNSSVWIKITRIKNAWKKDNRNKKESNLWKVIFHDSSKEKLG